MTKVRQTKKGSSKKELIPQALSAESPADYGSVLSDIVGLLENARRAAVRSVNSIMTATYWEIGRRIFEQEQAGAERAAYGQALLKRLSDDLSERFGRGFSLTNLKQMRTFYTKWPIGQTLSDQSSANLSMASIAEFFSLSWSHYVRLMQVESEYGRKFYEEEALRGGWTVRQLDRQIGSQFYERTALSKNKVAMLQKGARKRPEDRMTAEEEIKDPYVLEFLNLKDEYSESEIEEALIRHLEHFLLELGGDFTFIGRQRRLRVGDSWFRVDLLLFHRRLRCLVIIDLKLDKFTPADVGQMHMYLNYARENWTLPDENPPVGLILCAEKNEAVAHYSLEGLQNKMLAAKYQTTLPDKKTIEAELENTKKLLEERKKK